MSSEQEESGSDVEQDGSAESGKTSKSRDAEASPELTISLPDGSTSVADAILTNREMLCNPEASDIATEEDITHLSKAMESLSSKVEKTERQFDESQSRVTELEALLEQQQRQINELQSMVNSLAEILGTEAEWDSFDGN